MCYSNLKTDIILIQGVGYSNYLIGKGKRTCYHDVIESSEDIVCWTYYD